MSSVKPRGSRAWFWPAVVVLPVAIGTTVFFLLRVLELHVPWWQLWLVLLAAVLSYAAIDQFGGYGEIKPPVVHSVPRLVPVRPNIAVLTWEERLRSCETDLERYRFTVHRRLIEVTAERLRLRHFVDLDGDPQSAREILGPELFRFITETVSAPPTKSQTETIVQRIEEI